MVLQRFSRHPSWSNGRVGRDKGREGWKRRGREGMEKDRRVEGSGKRQVPPASGPRSAGDTIRDVTVRIG